jgi:sulfur carrier protein ThiS
MRMHRGSSKEVRDEPGASGILPLSASPGDVAVDVEVTRGGSIERRRLSVPAGTLVRTVLRSCGCAPEGSAVLDGETPLPLDTPIDRSIRLTVIPTFSGG